MQRYIIITVLLSLPLLISCQNNNVYSANPNIPFSSLYLDQRFLQPSTPSIESEQEIFMIDDDMRLMIENDLSHIYSTKKKALKLLKHIFAKEKIAISYSNNANLTARQTFHSHQANCMSLTIMAYALATAANMEVDFQQVDVPEFWVRNGQYNLLTGHVNLVVKSSLSPDKDFIFGNENIQIDFDPYMTKQTFPRRVIGKNTVLAMFYNNKGGQALVDGQYNIAYQYLKAATKADKYFSAAWGNLAVLYRLTDNIELAETVYRYAIQINPNNLTAYENLAILLRSNQNDKEADLIESQLLAKRIKNPFYHAVLADEAYYQHDYINAIAHYRKAIKLNGNIHELYFGLAKVYYQLDRLPEAKKALERALNINREKSTEHLYAAKLNLLKAELTN